MIPIVSSVRHYLLHQGPSAEDRGQLDGSQLTPSICDELSLLLLVLDALGIGRCLHSCVFLKRDADEHTIDEANVLGWLSAAFLQSY